MSQPSSPSFVSAAMAVILFYGIFTPLGVLLRLTGADPLRLRPAPAGQSHWRLRARPQPTAASLRQRS